MSNFANICAQLDVLMPLQKPREWLEYSVKKYIAHPTEELIADLEAHFREFLSLDGVIDNLELGGIYECEVHFQGKALKWIYELSQDNPSRATISLCLNLQNGGPKLWTPPAR